MATIGKSASGGGHRWKFFRAGGFDQALLETGADLAALDSLDQKLWVALSCPVSGIELDPKTLEFVDTDADGHMRAPEILAAAAWATSVLETLSFHLRFPATISYILSLHHVEGKKNQNNLPVIVVETIGALPAHALPINLM